MGGSRYHRWLLARSCQGSLGGLFRNYFDKPVVNGFGDLVGNTTKRLGRDLRPVQTGRIQQYMITALVIVAAAGILFYYLVILTQ